MIHAAPSYGAAFPPNAEWYMDTGASSHVTGNQCNLNLSHSFLAPNSHHIIVGDGSRLPATATGSAALTSRPFYLRNILLSPNIVANLISVCQFTRDN